ncbi:MAG TPA: N-acetyltransferase [Candidatus Acidoferrales bacterium]|nr:N-acetyltransferase [Candidatus Acidoferrales bacterium]
MKFSVRDYQPKDFDTLYLVDRACYEPEIAYTREELRWYLHLPSADCLVAEARLSAKSLASQIAGFVIVASQRTHGHVITMDVVENFRRGGVGTSLLREAEARLVRRGVSEVWLETATNNDPAIAFWHKHGYRTCGRIRNYYPGGLGAFSMSKPLPNSAAEEN